MLANLPIKQKMMVIALSTAIVAIASLSIGLGSLEWYEYQDRISSEAAVTAGLLADNAAHALIFSDDKTARQILDQLNIQPNITRAILTDAYGNKLAEYAPPNSAPAPAILPPEGKPLFFSGQLALTKNIRQDGAHIGSLYLQLDTREAYEDLLQHLALILAGVIVALFFAFLLISRFQKAVSGPIQTLADLMDRVSRENDFSLRANLLSQDELGQLGRGFDTMLGAIAERDGMLAAYRSQLEERVKIRTAELEKTNENLLLQISERQRTEEALRHNEARLAEAQRIAHIGNWEWHISSEKMFWSAEVYRILGYEPDAFAPNYGLFIDRLHPDDAGMIDSWFKQAALQTSCAAIDFRILPPGGESRIVHFQGELELSPEGKPERLIGTIQDMTQLKKAEHQLQELNENLEHRILEEAAKNREKDHVLIHQSRLAAMGEMVHNIAHQWRQPLSALNILLQNVVLDFHDGLLSTEELDRQAEIAAKLIDNMSRTIDDFRDFFRPDRQAVEFDLGAAVEEAVAIIEASLKNENISLEQSVPPGIAAFGYPHQISQATLNILINAKDAIKQRKVAHGQIRIMLASHEGRISLSIEDNGGGIPSDSLPRIFEPYFTTKENGSGIGLYMTKMIIEHNMNGSISAANTGTGCIFRISLPASGTQGNNLEFV
ncbi:MAG: PAS domain-containing protein [Sulfuricellaceae bacterium]|nr:PAS domain-containing protein [Sulfuricellaceae bacterium]